MKLWLKIYLFSLVLLIITLNLAGFILVQKLHNDSLKSEVKKAIQEEKMAASQLKNDSIFFQENNKVQGSEDIEFLNKLLERYRKTNNSKEGYVEILTAEDKVIYSDSAFPKSNKRDELYSVSDTKTNYVVRDVEGRKCLYAVGIQKIQGMQLKICYAKDISQVYVNKVNNYGFFIKLDLLICILFAVFMFFVSHLITKPIKVMTNSTKKVAEGNYSERVKIKSKDEFKELAENFNVMAKTVEEKIDELEFSNVAKETFINNFTHELKTPLTSIIGYASLINTSKYDEKLFYEASSYIYREGKRLESMTFKMMDFIYAKEGSVDLKLESIMDIIKEVMEVVIIKANEREVELITEGEEVELYLDKELMVILLNNIIDNAIKASDKGSMVKVKVESLHEKVIISIEDEGRGIPKEHLNKIFQPFYVVDKSRSRKNNGAGIGLSICKRITEALGGKIEIKSELGIGTKVNLIFKV